MIRQKISVTVVIPACNCENSIAQSVTSALTQTLAPKEIIVINDGSTDRTGDILKAMGRDIRLIEQENRGQGAARNAGWNAASGEYIAFLDADDYWKPQFIETCAAFLNKHAECVAVLTAWEKIIDDNTSVVVPPIMHQEKPHKPFIMDNYFRFWAEQDNVQTGAILLRKAVMDHAGGMREDLRMSQDLEYWAYLATFGKWAFIPRVLYVNNSRINARGSWWKRYRMRRKLCPTVEMWQERIVDNIRDSERPFFNMGLGRIAAGYAYSKVLGGDGKSARAIVEAYKDSLPVNPVTRLLIMGNRLGYPAWRFICGLLMTREIVKDFRLRYKKMTA